MSLSYDFGLGTNNNGDVYGVANNRDTTRSETFTYDQLNRVSSGQTTSTQWGTNYTFDIWGNLLQKTPMTGKNSGENLIQAVDGNNRLTGCGYDAAGNQTSDCLGHSITYDAENRVATTQGVTYTYDGDGVRVKKSSGKLYWGTLSESDLSGNVTADFIFFGGQRIARVDMPSGTVHYFFTDHLGSTGVVTNATGTTVEQDIDHCPFGEEVIYANTIADQNYRFMGKERDIETGYDFFGARYYNSMSGRWLSPDWTSSPSAVPYATLANPQTLNLYAFVQNNPATNAELDGHMAAPPIYNTHAEWHYMVCTTCLDGILPMGASATEVEDAATGVGNPQNADTNPSQNPAQTDNAQSGAGQQSAEVSASKSGAAPCPPPTQPSQGYDASKNGPEDPSKKGQPLYTNPAVKKALDEAWMNSGNGTARDGKAEAGFSIEFQNGVVSIANKVKSGGKDNPNELSIPTTPNTIAVAHTHGNALNPRPSGPQPNGKPGDIGSPVPNFVKSQSSLFVTVPGASCYIRLEPQ